MRKLSDFVSPRLGIRFEMPSPEMTVYHAGGERFLTFEELMIARRLAEQRATNAEQQGANLQARLVRLTRLAELSRKTRLGQASPDEIHELERLEVSPP